MNERTKLYYLKKPVNYEIVRCILDDFDEFNPLETAIFKIIDLKTLSVKQVYEEYLKYDKKANLKDIYRQIEKLEKHNLIIKEKDKITLNELGRSFCAYYQI